jgi:hypothetical protein
MRHSFFHYFLFPFLAAILLFCAIPVQAKSLPADVQPGVIQGMTISVTGSGEVQAVPDRLQLRFGVTERNESVQEGSAVMGKILGKALEFLKASNIDEKHIQTSHVHIRREERYDHQTGEATFMHYALSQSFSIILIDPSMYEKIFAGLINLGINEVQEFSFLLSDPQKYHSEALALAVKDAQRKAGVLADTAGFKLGKIVSIQEGQQWQPLAPRMMLGGAVGAIARSADSGSGIGEGMALGTIPVRVDISVVVLAH